MESQDLDKLFRNAFEQAEEAPSNRVWEGIEQELAKDKKVIPFYIKYRARLSIAAAFMVFFGIGLTFYKQPIPTGKEKIEEVLTSIEKKNNTSDKQSGNNITPKDSRKIESERLVSNNVEIITVDRKKVTPSNQSNTISEAQLIEEKTEIEDKQQEIIEHDPILATVDVNLTITQPDYQEIKTIESINNDMQTSYAFTEPKEEVKSSIVTRVLNGITKNILTKSIDIQDNKEIEFKNDEEGSITLNIFNSLAKK